MPEMTAAELRARAIRLLRNARPTAADVAEADAWARVAISAAISETGAAPQNGDQA